MSKEQEIKEAIDMLDGLQYNIMDEIGFHYKGYVCCNEEMHKYDKDFDSIKQVLLKAQEQEKEKATAWGIVISKNVDMLLIKKYDNVSDYNSAVWLSGREKLTEEEFNLLKEVLE